MGLFDGLKNAEVYTQGNYLKVGLFDVRIIRCLAKQTQRSGLGFIAELEILTSTNPDHPIGSTVSWFQGMSKNPQTAMSAIKEFAIALFGMDPTKDAQRIKAELEPNIDAIMNDAIGPNNPLAGRCIHLETFMKKTREKGADFTVHRWSPFLGEMPTHALPAPRPQQEFQAPVPAQGYQPGVYAPQPVMSQQQYQAPHPPPGAYQAPAPQGPPPGAYQPPYQPPQGMPQQQYQPPQGMPQYQAPQQQQYQPPQTTQYMPPAQPQMQAQPPGPPPAPIWDPLTQKYRMP